VHGKSGAKIRVFLVLKEDLEYTVILLLRLPKIRTEWGVISYSAFVMFHPETLKIFSLILSLLCETKFCLY
jgi:hypothetical protein